MLEYEDYVKECETLWKRFINSIILEVENLKQEKADNEELKSKFNMLFDGIKSVESAIKSKDFLIDFDPSLKDYVDALVFFKEKDNLENLMVKDSFEKIKESKRVKSAYRAYDDIGKKIEEIIKEIETKNIFLDNPHDVNKILEYAKHQELDDEEIKQLLFYSLYEVTLRKDKTKKDKKKNIKKVEIQKKEEKEEAPKIELELPEDTESLEYEKELLRFEKIQTDNKELLDSKYADLKEGTNEYTSYTAYDISELKEMGVNDEIISKVITHKLLIIKKEINKEVENIKLLSDGTLKKDASDYIVELINEYEKLLSKLSELNIENDEEMEVKNQNVYFAHDEGNSLLVPDNDNHSKKIYAFASKFDNNEGQVKINIKRMLGVEKEAQRIGKTVYMLNAPYSISYVKINQADKEAIYIITAGPRENIDIDTAQVINDYYDDIVNQMKLIENSDYIEMQNQVIIRALLEESLTEDTGKVL